jgi:hypothetical protein
MTIWGILSFLCRVVGLASWADKLWQSHRAIVKARSEANAPVTDQEEADDLLK